MNELTVSRWADTIRGHLKTGVQSFIQAGRDLENAVTDFKQHDDRHWKHAYSELLTELSISQQTAHTLRTIAKNPVLSDPEYYGALPASWSTLGELASLPAPELEQRLEAGDITPELKRDQVRQWKHPNHLLAGGSLQFGSDLGPVILGFGLPSEGATFFPDDVTFEESWECFNRATVFVGLLGENVRLGAIQYRRFVESGDLSFLPQRGDPTYMQMLNDRAKAPVFWAAYLTSLESGRPVLGVVCERATESPR